MSPILPCRTQKSEFVTSLEPQCLKAHLKMSNLDCQRPYTEANADSEPWKQGTDPWLLITKVRQCQTYTNIPLENSTMWEKTNTLWYFHIAIENCHLWWIFPLNIEIFHTYVRKVEIFHCFPIKKWHVLWFSYGKTWDVHRFSIVMSFYQRVNRCK